RKVANVASSANALLSRLEPIEVLDHPLPGRVRGRGLLLARFGEDDAGLTVAVAHLSLGAQSRRAQLSYIAELLGDYPNAVLMGDFNCTADRPEMSILYRNTSLQPPDCHVHTFPSWRPNDAIDHDRVTSSLACSTMRALPATLSGHLALSVELDVPEVALRTGG